MVFKNGQQESARRYQNMLFKKNFLSVVADA